MGRLHRRADRNQPCEQTPRSALLNVRPGLHAPRCFRKRWTVRIL